MLLDQDRVPASFDEALVLLDGALTPNEKAAYNALTAAQMFALQDDLARTLKNDWSLDESTTPLRLFFRDLGLNAPHEIALLLVDAYWRIHNRESISVAELAAEYQEE